MKRQDDVLLGHAGGFEFVDDWPIRSVVLDPNLSIDDVQVQNWTVDSPVAIPSHIENFVVVRNWIDDGLRTDVAI